MIPVKNLQFGKLCTIMIFFCILSPRFQGNSSSSCEISGICGPYGVCNSRNSPICSCLQGFNPRSAGNWSSGCLRRVPLSCEAGNDGGTEDRYFVLPNVTAPAPSERWSVPGDRCEGRCLSDCSCVAYGFDSNGCQFWTQPLIDVRNSPPGSGSDLYIRLSYELDQKKGSKPNKIIIIVVVVGLIMVSICICFSWKWIARRRAKRRSLEPPVNSSVRDALSRINLEDLPLFELEVLANATNNFSEFSKLGQGGFGVVYKGELVNGREIAVKRLSQASGQGMQEFMNEVVLISKLQHRNLVKLLGCCVQNREMMLVYEYMPNKSLDFFLFSNE